MTVHTGLLLRPTSYKPTTIQEASTLNKYMHEVLYWKLLEACETYMLNVDKVYLNYETLVVSERSIDSLYHLPFIPREVIDEIGMLLNTYVNDLVCKYLIATRKNSKPVALSVIQSQLESGYFLINYQFHHDEHVPSSV